MNERIELPSPSDMTEGEKIAQLRMGPALRHANTANCTAAPAVKFDGEASTVDAAAVLNLMAERVAGGDLRHISDTLLAQSVTLDTAVTEMMRRAWANVGEYPDAFQRYMNLALKAQAQSRATLEALARLHQPREQTVHHRHYHVGPDGKAIFVENMNGGFGNAGNAYQPLAASAALPCPDPRRESLPVARDPRKETLPNARRKGKRGAKRQSKCA